MDWNNDIAKLGELQDLLEQCAQSYRDAWNKQAVPLWQIQQDHTPKRVVSFVKDEWLPVETLGYAVPALQAETLRTLITMLATLDQRKAESDGISKQEGGDR